MPENEDAQPMSIEDAIEMSGGSVEKQESDEQQATEQTETTEETASETQTEETSSETQEDGKKEETETKEETEESEAKTDSEIIDLNSEETEETQEEEQEQTETQESPVDFGEILNGEFESEEDLGNYIDGLHTQIEELKGANEPEFANDAMKKANDYVKAGGKAADFFRVQGVDVDTMNPVEKLVTHLKWNNPNLTDSKAREYILEKYEISDDEDGSENTQALIDSNKAGEEIKKIQADDTPGKPSGLSEEEWAEKLEQQTQEQNEALLREDETRMSEWENPLKDSIKNLKEKGIVIDLGNGKGMKYAFDADDKYVENLMKQAEEALFLSGTSVKDNPKLAQQMIEMQFKSDHIDKIVKAAIVKGANSANENWFKEIHNPSPIARGDKTQKETNPLPTAEEAMKKVFDQ